MNAQLFTDAMSELNDKYVMEAVSYQRKSKPHFNTWLSKVACVFLAVLLTGSAVLTFSVEARAAFFGWVREQVETYYMYFFEGNAAVTEPAKYELGWMPENCIFVTSYETAGGEVYIYTDERDTLIQFTYTSEPDNEKIIKGMKPYMKRFKIILAIFLLFNIMLLHPFRMSVLYHIFSSLSSSFLKIIKNNFNLIANDVKNY